MNTKKNNPLPFLHINNLHNFSLIGKYTPFYGRYFVNSNVFQSRKKSETIFTIWLYLLSW